MNKSNNTPNNTPLPDTPASLTPAQEEALSLSRLLSGLDPRLIAEAINEAIPPAAAHPPAKHGLQRLLLLLAAALALFSITSMAFAINTLQQENHAFYLRLLSPEDLDGLAIAQHSGEDSSQPDPKRLFAALDSADVYSQYIAINRLVELYNDPALRSQAIARLQPFLDNPEPKLAEAAAYALDILTDTLSSPRLCHMADGSVVFTLFPDYSDYGSHNQLWCLREGALSPYISFSAPYNYIADLLPSPDGRLLAVGLCSNKSSQLVILDDAGGYCSTELISTSRILWPQQLGGEEGRRRRADSRIDNETYSSYRQLHWLDNNRLQFVADLAYNDSDTPYCAVDICDSVSVTYDFPQNTYEMTTIELNNY